MSRIEVTTATAPASWASYLVNGDASGFDYSNTPDNRAGDRDMAACDAWVESLAADGWHVVSCEGESEFAHYCDAFPGRFNGDVVTYILHKVQS